ncbi:ABC transporter permease [Alsobacter sp. R-9]
MTLERPGEDAGLGGASSRDLPETLLRRPSGWSMPDLLELWSARSLIVALVAGDIRARYRQTLMGFAWNLLQPLMAMLVFTVIFGRIGAFASDGKPYALFFFAGFLIWQFFHKAVGLAVPSLASNAQLVAKVYFPRLIVVVYPIATAMVELIFSAVIFSLICLYYGFIPSGNVAFLPLFVFLTALSALAVAVWLAPLNVYVRDVQVALPSLLQLGFFVTPIVYSPSVLGEPWRTLVYLNPMAAIVEGARWSLLGGAPPHLEDLALSVAVVALILGSGLVFFQRTSLTMVDRL